jgi:hypothetical protein
MVLGDSECLWVALDALALGALSASRLSGSGWLLVIVV